MEEYRNCPRCSVSIPLSEYGIDRKRKSGRAYLCKKCSCEKTSAYNAENRDAVRERDRRYYRENSEKIKANVKKWAAGNPEKVKALSFRKRLRKYKLTAESYMEMLQSQDFRCQICLKEIKAFSDSPGKTAHVDHDHATGAVRGLLCGKCNRGIGFFGDDPRKLRGMADYLEGASRDYRNN